MLLVVEKMPANFKQHCLVGKRKLSNKLLEVNYKIYYVYFVEWRIGDHLLRGGVPSTVATHCRYKKRVHLQLNQSVKNLVLGEVKPVQKHMKYCRASRRPTKA